MKNFEPLLGNAQSGSSDFEAIDEAATETEAVGEPDRRQDGDHGCNHRVYQGESVLVLNGHTRRA